jgi:sigma-B regulation protein RsbU (phosphoserine phosphatase)
MKRLLRFGLLVLFFTLVFAYAGINIYCTLVGFVYGGDLGWALNGGNSIAIDHQSNARTDGLKDGDQLVSLNGVEYKSYYDSDRFVDLSRPGDLYTLVIRRDGNLIPFRLTVAPHSLFQKVSALILSLILLVFPAVGFVVFLLKPEDPRAVLLGLMLATFYGTSGSPFLLAGGLPGPATAVVVATLLLCGLFCVFFLHFFLIFPDHSPLLRRFPPLKYLIYCLFVIAVGPSSLMNLYVRAFSPERFYETSRTPVWLIEASTVVISLYLIGGVVSLVVNYRFADSLSKRKLRVVIAGILGGFLPFLALGIGDALLHPTDSFATYTSPIILVVTYLAFLALLLVPISFGYAIVRHQVIPVSLIVRRSLQYLFARNVLRVLIALPIIGLILSVVANPHRTIDEIFLRNSLFYLLMAAAVGLGLLFRRRLTGWLDRKFFREAYNQEKILAS